MSNSYIGNALKTLIFDMYGVIIKESKGNFIPYTYNHFAPHEHERIASAFKTGIFTKAGNGEITADEFLTALGFTDPQFHSRDYIENHLTIDTNFYDFAEKTRHAYRFALLSNDVAAWSKHITDYYDLNKYFPEKIISADVKYRKPQREIYEIALARLGVPARECIFIDNSVKNLHAASELGIDVILFNRDGEEFDGKMVYSFGELLRLLEVEL